MCTLTVLLVFNIYQPFLKSATRSLSRRSFIAQKKLTECRESGINLFKQRWVEKCHSHDEVCQRALKV